MNKAFKYRIYPTIEQKNFLAQQFGAARFIYNYFLAYKKDLYARTKKISFYKEDSKLLTKLKKDPKYSWLKSVNSQSTQSSIKNLDTAYKNYFDKRAKLPRFHSKKNNQCIKIPQNFSIENNQLFIPKLKTGIDIVLHQDLPIKPPLSCFISKTASGKYFASFSCDVDITPLKTNDKVIGLDLGLKSLLIDSDGNTIENKRFYRKHEKKLIILQRQLSKKKKGSKNKDKQRLKVAELHEYVANCRKDFIHKTTKKIINENQVIIVESLAVKNMIQNHKLAKSIADASWGEIVRQLEYKAKFYGRTFQKIGRFFASSKTCNACKHVLEKLNLETRYWICPSCNTQHDRDINAAKNIKDEGLKLIEIARAEALATSACGMYVDVKQNLVEVPSQILELMKQEAPSFRTG